MPLLRNSQLRVFQRSPVKSVLNLTTREHLSEEHFKKEYDKIISKISTTDIKNCLKSSPSEAQFYSEICSEELKKLKEEREELEKHIRLETDVNRKKDAEAARIIKKLWEEAHKISIKGKKPGGVAKTKGLKPEDVRKVWQVAKKMSNQAKQKRRKLMAERNQLDSKIQLAKQAVQFCNKFGHSSLKY